MNIFDSTPRKVKCVANYDTPIYSIHKDELEIGKLYTVKKVEVNSWCTAVYLEEFPYERGYAFNSVYFEELEGEEKEDTNLYNNTCPYYDTENGCCRKSEVPRIAIPLDVNLDEAIRNEEFKVIRFADVPEPKIENRWIPVTERLPELNEEVIVTYRLNYVWNGDIPYTDDVTYAEYRGLLEDKPRFRRRFESFNLDVLAWMPLPEPWKGDEG